MRWIVVLVFGLWLATASLDAARIIPRAMDEAEDETELLELTNSEGDNAVPTAAAAAVVTGRDSDQLESTAPYLQSGTIPHPITASEQEYTPEHQLDRIAEAEQRANQISELERFKQRLDTQVLAKRAEELTARTARTAALAVTPTPIANEPITNAQTHTPQRGGSGSGSGNGGDENWLNAMRLSSVHAKERSEQTLRAKNSARAKQHSRSQHRHKHALNLGQRIRARNRNRNRGGSRSRGRGGSGDDDGGDEGGDAEGERYMSSDEAKGQEEEYTPDESSNMWWWGKLCTQLPLPLLRPVT